MILINKGAYRAPLLIKFLPKLLSFLFFFDFIFACLITMALIIFTFVSSMGIITAHSISNKYAKT